MKVTHLTWRVAMFRACQEDPLINEKNMEDLN